MCLFDALYVIIKSFNERMTFMKSQCREYQQKSFFWGYFVYEYMPVFLTMRIFICLLYSFLLLFLYKCYKIFSSFCSKHMGQVKFSVQFHVEHYYFVAYISRRAKQFKSKKWYLWDLKIIFQHVIRNNKKVYHKFSD